MDRADSYCHSEAINGSLGSAEYPEETFRAELEFWRLKPALFVLLNDDASFVEDDRRILGFAPVKGKSVSNIFCCFCTDIFAQFSKILPTVPGFDFGQI